MAAEEHKALYRRLLTALNSGDLEGAAALLAPNAVNHTPCRASRLASRASATAWARCWVRSPTHASRSRTSSARGTHSGPFAGLPPTGRAVEVTYMDMLRVAEGRFVEHWAQVDQLGLLQQLGAIPAPGQAAG